MCAGNLLAPYVCAVASDLAYTAYVRSRRDQAMEVVDYFENLVLQAVQVGTTGWRGAPGLSGRKPALLAAGRSALGSSRGPPLLASSADVKEGVGSSVVATAASSALSWVGPVPSVVLGGQSTGTQTPVLQAEEDERRERLARLGLGPPTNRRPDDRE